MHPDFGPRRSGRTTKMLLQVAHALVHGESVLIVAQNDAIARSLFKRLNAIFENRLPLYGGAQWVILPETGGTVDFAVPDTLERVVKGRTFNSFFSDPGELEDHELRLIAPCIRLQGHEAPEQQTEFEFDLVALDVEEAPPKDSGRASRRTFTSR